MATGSLSPRANYYGGIAAQQQQYSSQLTQKNLAQYMSTITTTTGTTLGSINIQLQPMQTQEELDRQATVKLNKACMKKTSKRLGTASPWRL